MKHFGNSMGIAVVKVIFLLAATYLEHWVLYTVVTGVSGTLEQWLDIFVHRMTIVITLAAIASLLWYGLGQLVFKINDWKRSGKRAVWFLLAVLPTVAILYCIVFMPYAEKGAWYASAFYIINGLGSYYLATVFFSASSFKYTPVGAKNLRRW